MSKKTAKRRRRRVSRPTLTQDEIALAIDDVVRAAKQQRVPARVVVDAFAEAIAKKYLPPRAGGGRKADISEMRSFLENLRAAHELPELVDSAVLAAGREVFSDDGAVGTWLSTPAKFAGGMRPLELLRTRQGKRKVIAVLVGLARGNII